MENAKKIVALAVLLAAGLALAFAEPQGLIAVVLTQLVGLAVIGAGGKKLSKPVVSIVVFLISGALAYFKLDGAFPDFPAYGGDFPGYIVALSAFAQAFAAAAAPIVGAAMVTYNVVIEKLLAIIGGSVGYRLEPK